jgi:hypothetical protein
MSAPGSTNNIGGGDRYGAFPHCENGFDGALVRAGGPAGWAGRGGLPVIPSPRQGRHDGVRGASGRRGQSERSDHATKGVMTCTTRTDQGKAEGGVHASLGRWSRART